jgi:ketosteroid isomerase-like protein
VDRVFTTVLVGAALVSSPGNVVHWFIVGWSLMMKNRNSNRLAIATIVLTALAVAWIIQVSVWLDRTGPARSLSLFGIPARAAEPQAEPQDSAGEIRVIHALLERQNEAWNQADIDTFMVAYWDSPELSFSSGGGTTRGWQATRQRYRTRYPDRAAMGQLTFSELETRLLGPDAALTLGRWKLERVQPIGGNFSLVWQKFNGEWRIVHDHSSSTPNPQAPNPQAPNQPAPNQPAPNQP